MGIFFEKEGIDTLNPSSDFMLSIYATVAEGELISMGDNVKWAARKRYEKGSVELTAIYGYDYKNGTLSPNPAEAAIVKEIYERYANGEGHNKIARSLNDRGVKRKFSAGLWVSQTVAGILSNEKYIGCAITNKTYKSGGKTFVNDGTVPQYYIENSHEAIVSRDVWDAVQERSRRMSETNKGKTSYPLSPFSSKIKCWECGKGYMRRKNNRNTPYEKWIWSCQTYIQHGRKYCNGRNIREKDLHALFLSAYNEAAEYQSQDDPTVSLTGSIKILLQQERELVALKVKGYITREQHDEQHSELLRQIKDTEAALLLATRRLGKTKYAAAAEYEDSLVGALEVAEIYGYTVMFKFKNGADIQRTFNNDTDRAATWNKKLGRMI